MKREDALTKWLPIVKMGVESMPELEDAVNIAISDVEKMEKIEQLMRGWNNFNSYERMCEIYEVVEDGNENKRTNHR